MVHPIPVALKLAFKSMAAGRGQAKHSATTEDQDPTRARDWEKTLKSATNLFKKICFYGVTLFAVHSAGCFNYVIAHKFPVAKRTWIGAVCPNFKELSLWDRYVTAIYWSTLTTTCYGDLHAENV